MNNYSTQAMNQNVMQQSRVKIVNGARPAEGAHGLISVSAACRVIGVKQSGTAKKQMASLNVPIVALGGARGGVYLVRLDDVLKAKAKRAELALPKPSTISLPKADIVDIKQTTPMGDRVSELHDRLVRLESKLDKLLSVWGVAAA